MKRAGRPTANPRIYFVSHYNDAQHRERFFLDERGRLELASGARRRTPQDPILYYQEHHQPMPTDEFLRIVSDTEPLIQEEPVDSFEHFWDPMPLDDFLAAMGWEEPAPEEAVFETAAGFQAPNASYFPAQPVTSGWDTLYPGHAGISIPCLGVLTDSDSAGAAKTKLLIKYNELGLELRCHTCGEDLRGGKFVAGYFLEKSWIGDHQPPTSAYRWPEKMQVLTSFAQSRNVWVVESSDGMYQTRYPFPDQLGPLFGSQAPHPYPRYPAFSVRPQRYVYPQCEECSRLQSHSL